MTILETVSPMAKKRAETLTRISPEALEAAKVACAFRGMTLVEYLSRIVKEAADRDIDEAYERRKKGDPKRK